MASGETVVDVPPKLSARTRVFATGQGRKTDETDAHWVALAATGMTGLRRVAGDEQLVVLQILADTWGRLLARARPALTPVPALRRSHFPDPPSTTLRRLGQLIPLVLPAAFHHHRTAAAVKRTLLDGEDRHTLLKRE